MSDYKPAIGEECEVYHPLNECWYLATITAETDLNYVVIKRNESHEYLLEKSLNKFRPIRTQEEKEREEAIEKLRISLFRGKGYCLSKETELEICNAVLGEGYRLVGEKVDADQMSEEWKGGEDFFFWLLNNYDIYKRKAVK